MLGPRGLCIFGSPSLSINPCWPGARGVDFGVHFRIQVSIGFQFPQKSLQLTFSQQGRIFFKWFEFVGAVDYFDYTTVTIRSVYYHNAFPLSGFTPFSDCPIASFRDSPFQRFPLLKIPRFRDFPF